MADKGTSLLFLCLDPALHGSEICCKAVRSCQRMANASLGQLHALESRHKSPQKTTAAGKAFWKSLSQNMRAKEKFLKEEKNKKVKWTFLMDLGEAFWVFQLPFCPTQKVWKRMRVKCPILEVGRNPGTYETEL